MEGEREEKARRNQRKMPRVSVVPPGRAQSESEIM